MPVSPITFYRTSIKALIFDENKKILLAKDGGNNGKWDFPGGGMDWGETPQVCLAREIQEEMGLTATWIADHPSYFYSGQSDKGLCWYLDIGQHPKNQDMLQSIWEPISQEENIPQRLRRKLREKQCGQTKQ